MNRIPLSDELPDVMDDDYELDSDVEDSLDGEFNRLDDEFDNRLDMDFEELEPVSFDDLITDDHELDDL